MTVSVLIQKLQRALTEQGDLPVYAEDKSNTEQDGESEISGIRIYAKEMSSLSQCCGSEMRHDSDICPECGEHTDGEMILPERIFLKQ